MGGIIAKIAFWNGSEGLKPNTFESANDIEVSLLKGEPITLGELS